MRRSITLILALLGLFASLYLLWAYTSPTRRMVCYTGGCDAVRASAYAHIGGFPMPLLGVAGYGLIILLIIAESLLTPAYTIEIRYALAGATGFGFLFSLYLEYLQGFVIHAFCTWCITSGIVMTILFALAIYNIIHPVPEDGPPAQLAQLRRYFALSVAAVLIGVPAFYQLSAHGEAPPPPPPPPTQESAAELVRPESHVWGNPNAPVTVVEFGDFECPVCGSEEPVSEEVRNRYKDQIRFVFRQFPLAHIHPFAQRMAEASECAGEQGKFWEAVHQIYSRQDDQTEEGLKRDAAAIGLDLEKFNQCMAGKAAQARVEQDVKDGKALDVNSTPTFYIGNQVVTDVPDFQEFSRLIDRELAARQGASPSSASSSASSAATAEPSQSAPPSAAPQRATKSTPESTSTPATGESPSLGLLGSNPGGAFSAFSSGQQGCSEAEAAQKQPTLINTHQLQQLLAERSKPLFVDVRPASEFESARIPGAINIPVDEMSKRWDSLPKDRTIVFYESGRSSGDICASGRTAGRILLQHGYTFDLVKVYQDGLAGWQKSGLSTQE